MEPLGQERIRIFEEFLSHGLARHILSRNYVDWCQTDQVTDHTSSLTFRPQIFRVNVELSAYYRGQKKWEEKI